LHSIFTSAAKKSCSDVGILPLPHQSVMGTFIRWISKHYFSIYSNKILLAADCYL